MELNLMRKKVFKRLHKTYIDKGTDFHFKVNKLKIDGMGSKRIGRACVMLKDEGFLIQRNHRPAPPIYKTNFEKNRRNKFW